MEKYKVIIVDDEFRISKLIEKLIDWNRLNLECIATINNGEKALEIIEQENPDIVITDIRMPKVTGLDIINQFNNKCKFIVISGYKDFEYAHQAMKYGVNNYLLKPVDKIELNETLEKLSKEIETNNESLNEKKNLKLKVKQSDKQLKSNIFSSLIDTKILDSTYLNNHLNNNNSNKLFIIKLDYCKMLNQDILQENNIVNKIIQIINTTYEETSSNCILTIKPNLTIYTLINFDEKNTNKINDNISSIFEKIKSELTKFEIFYFTIGLINETFKSKEIISKLNLCEKVINNRIKLGTDRIITNDDISINNLEIKTLYHNEIDNIVKMIFNGKEEEIKNAVFELFYKLRILKDIDYSFFYSIPVVILDKVFNAEFINEGLLMNLQKTILNNINYIYSIRTMSEYLSLEFIQISKKIEQIKETKNVPIIRKVILYIEKNYSKKIILEDVADKVKLNPVYLSSLFKKETGYNFTTYLTNYRINMAKKELIDSSDTIVAIASKIGYKDSRYFSQTFKKIVGIKPAIYRKMYMNGKNK